MKSKISAFVCISILLGISEFVYADNSDVSQKNYQNKTIFLDYASSWPANEQAAKKFNEVNKLYGNSSGMNQHAGDLFNLEAQSAQVLADKLRVKIGQIHFTSGATAANNVAILGVAYKYPKCHLITSKI